MAPLAPEAGPRQAEVVAALVGAIGGTLDLDTVLQNLARAARELTESDVGAVGFREPGSETVLMRYVVGSRLPSGAGLTIEPGRGLGGQALVTGRPCRTDDYATDPSFPKDYSDRARTDGVSAVLVVPIEMGGRVAGLIYAANRSRRPFSERDEAILARLADQACTAIRNAQLFARETAARARAEAAEQARRESEARYRGLVEGSIQGMCIHRDCVVQFANPAAARILGYETAQELVGADLRRHFPPPDAARLEGSAPAALDGEAAPAPHECEPVRRDGTAIAVEVLASALPWDGEPAVLVTMLDVSERRRLEAQLRQAQKMEAVGRLAGGIAHDFNNLLTVIGGRTRLIMSRLRAGDPARRDAELAEKAAWRAASLTRQLLAFSRKQVLQPRVLDLNTVVTGTEAILGRLIGEHIRVATVLAPDLERVKADPAQLEQVLMNLAVNARDAMPEGGRLTIETASVTLDDRFARRHPGARPGRYVMLAVTDTGIGMDEGTRARVFEPFFTTKDVGQGTGLGLSTVYGIVKQSDGYISVESEPGRGAAFRVYLPRVTDPPEAGPAASPPPDVPPGRETILLVEDEADVRDLGRDILEGAGYVVLAAATVADAERLCRDHPGPIALLLTDVVMPRMSGRALAERLAAVRPGMRVLYVSGYTDDAIARHGVLEPGIALLPKPFTPAALACKVREVLDAPPAPAAPRAPGDRPARSAPS